MAQHKDDTLLEAQRAKLKPPPMFKVMLLNDDYTPMEFVVVVLQKFFAATRERATQSCSRSTGKASASVGSIRATSPPPKCSKSRHTPESTSIRCSA